MPLLHASFPQYYFPFDQLASMHYVSVLAIYIRPLFKIGSIKHVLDSGLIIVLGNLKRLPALTIVLVKHPGTVYYLPSIYNLVTYSCLFVSLFHLIN